MLRCVLVILRFVLALSRADDLSNWKDPGLGQEHKAFIVQLSSPFGGGGTGVLIHRDWVLTATHIFEGTPDVLRKDENGDFVIEDLDSLIVRITKSGSKTEPKWGKILDVPVVDRGNGLWRKVVKIFSTGFEGVERSYLGKDLALMKLEKTAEIPLVHYFSPICLPDPDKPDLKEDRSEQLYFAGFGRRMMPHCITDDRGPERFKPCGRQLDCGGHYSEYCKLDFKFKNVTYNRCLTTETPSSDDPVCQRLLKQTGMTDFQHKTFVFGPKGKLKTTCFPFEVKEGEKGWCTTREPWIDENEEPQFDKGWGFCSDEIFQSQCGSPIDDIEDTSPMPVTQLENQHCVDQLRVNLIKENLQVDESLYNDLDANGVLCVGQNFSYNITDFTAFKIDEEGKFEETPLTIEQIEIIKAATKEDVLSAPTGGSCFGDSGGPLFKFVGKKPVLIGIMSFLLWGFCRSRYDPSYYDRVHKYYDFIFKHVPKDEVCFA